MRLKDDLDKLSNEYQQIQESISSADPTEASSVLENMVRKNKSIIAQEATIRWFEQPSPYKN